MATIMCSPYSFCCITTGISQRFYCIQWEQ